MRTYVFARNIMELFNGFSIWEVEIYRGLKQGNPLAHCLFLLVEGLSGLFSWSIKLDIFSGFRVGSSDLVLTHLHYMDDTCILVDPFIENL